MRGLLETIEFDVLVHGSPVREYPYTDGKTYIWGQRESKFVLRVRNHSARRILAVPTVDGLSVMDGKKGSVDSGGYVVAGYSALEIPGWRLHDEGVARFVFTGPGESYAGQIDTPVNVGVIGCAIFEEKVTPVLYTYPHPRREPWYPKKTIRSGSDTPSGGRDLLGSDEVRSFGGETVNKGLADVKEQSSDRATGNLGTGFGEYTSHRVQQVRFDRLTESPVCVFTIYYDDRAGLEARGINLRGVAEIAAPNPFPADTSTGCKPPIGWRG